MMTQSSEQVSMSYIILLPQNACGVLQLHRDLCASFDTWRGGKETVSRLAHSLDEAPTP